MQAKLNIFLDTSALLSGLNSTFGAFGFIISLFKANKIKITITGNVIEEAKEVIEKKFPLIQDRLVDFLLHKPYITKPLSKKDVKNAYLMVPTEDAHIIAGAKKSKVKFLITSDKKLIKIANEKYHLNLLPFKTLLPGEYLNIYRGNFLTH